MAEETTPSIAESTQEQLAKVTSMFSGGVMNPLAKEQVRIEAPPLPKISIPPAPEMPGSQIPKLSGNYSGELDTPAKYANALKNHMENAGSYAKDQYKYGKNYSYDADYTGLNFQRYYNAPRVYKQVGFSPWRDNEKIYNNNMTWWDSFKRSSGQAGHLFGTGFSSMLPWNAWDGDDTDEKSAKDMERAHAIGADNRGGIGAFANNLMLDSGYTLGIGAEFAAEEIGIWAASTAAAPFTGGGSWAAAGVETGLQAAKIGKLLKNFGAFGKGLNKLHEGLAALKDVDKARDVFNYVKSGKPVTELMKILTPGTFAFGAETYNLAKAAKMAKSGENIYTLARAAKGVGAFYRDSREIAAVLSESKLEGGSTELEMRKRLTDSFFEKNGRMPNADEYQQIDQHAYDAGRETYLWNLPALWISNKIVFDKAFKGIPGVQTFRKELSEGLAGKLAFDEAAAKAGKNAWSTVETGMKANAKALYAMGKTPTKLLRHTVGKFATYTNKNLTEALQEQYQDAVSNSMKEYHTARFEHPGRTAMHESWGDVFAKNLGKQFTTAQGWETFASGFLMGSLVQIPQHIVYDVAPKKFYQITDPKGFTTFKAQQAERTTRVVDALNAATKDPQRFFNPNVSNAVSQGIMNEHATDASVNGDTKQFKDINDEAMFDHFHTLIQTDKLSLVTDMLKDMIKLSGEELEQAYGKVEPTDGEAKAFYNKKIDSMLARAEQIERRSKYIEDKYGNPFNPHKFSPGKDPERYDTEAHNWQGWEDAKKAAVFADHAFDRTVERMKSITDDMTTNIPVAKASAHDFTVLMDAKQLFDEMTLLRSEVRSMKDIPGTKRESAQKQKKLDALEEYASALSRYKMVLQEHAKTDEHTDLQKADMTDSLKALHNTLGKYTRVIADLNDSHVFDKNIDSAFTKIKDFYHLKSDSNRMAQAVNKLENPELFTIYAKRSSIIKKDLHEQRAELYKKSYEGKLDGDNFNQLLNQIFELGAYMYPEDVASFRDKEIIPTNFYDLTTGERVPINSEKYKAIKELIWKYYATLEKPVRAEGEPIGDITNREFADFVDNNIVSQERLEDIAEKVIVKEPLSERETAIFAGKTSEIEEIIKSKPVVEEGETTTSTPTEAQGKVKITPQTPITVMETEAPELVEALIEGYKTMNRRLYAGFDKSAAEEGQVAEDLLMTPKALTMTDAEIKKHPTFTHGYLKLAGEGMKIINDYNVETGRTLEPQIIQGEATTKAQPTPQRITRQMRSDLVNLGYDEAAINRMGFVEAKRLADKRIKPGSEAAAKVQAQAQLEKEKQEKRKQALKDIAKSLEAVNSITTLETFQKKMEEMMTTGEFTEAGIISDEIIALIDAKKADLKVTYDAIGEGEAIRHKKYGTMVVLQKDADSIKVTKFGETGGKIYQIMKDNIPNEFDYMEGMDITPVEASDIENDQIKATKEARDKVLDDDDKRKELETGAPDISDDDLLEDLGDNCTVKPKD